MCHKRGTSIHIFLNVIFKLLKKDEEFEGSMPAPAPAPAPTALSLALPQPPCPGFHPRPSFCSPVPGLPKANSSQPNTHPQAHNAPRLCAQYLLPEPFLLLSYSRRTSPTPSSVGLCGHLIATCCRPGCVSTLASPTPPPRLPSDKSPPCLYLPMLHPTS